MKVRVERRRRGRRRPEVDYVEAGAPRERPETLRAATGPWGDGASRALVGGAASDLRLPWRIKGGDDEGTR